MLLQWARKDRVDLLYRNRTDATSASVHIAMEEESCSAESRRHSSWSLTALRQISEYDSHRTGKMVQLAFSCKPSGYRVVKPTGCKTNTVHVTLYISTLVFHSNSFAEKNSLLLHVFNIR